MCIYIYTNTYVYMYIHIGIVMRYGMWPLHGLVVKLRTSEFKQSCPAKALSRKSRQTGLRPLQKRTDQGLRQFGSVDSSSMESKEQGCSQVFRIRPGREGSDAPLLRVRAPKPHFSWIGRPMNNS